LGGTRRRGGERRGERFTGRRGGGEARGKKEGEKRALSDLFSPIFHF
jgi:hypothetical protein